MSTAMRLPTNQEIVKSFPQTGFVASISSFLLATFAHMETYLTLISLCIGVVLGLLGIVSWFWKNRDLLNWLSAKIRRKPNPPNP